MLIPSGFLYEILKYMKVVDTVSFCFSPEENSFFQNRETNFIHASSTESFPFEKVVPAEKKTTIHLDREELHKT